MTWETACRFSTCVVRSFLYLDTDFVDILVRVPQPLPFSQTYLFRLFQKRHKDIQRFQEMKLFQKDRFKHELISLSHHKFFLARSNAKSHSFGSNVQRNVLLGPWQQYFLYPNTEILLILESRIIYSLSQCLQPALWRTLSVCRVLLWCLLHIIMSVNVHQVISGTGKSQKIVFLFAKLCCFH